MVTCIASARSKSAAVRLIDTYRGPSAVRRTGKTDLPTTPY